MRKVVFGEPVDIITEDEVIHSLLIAPGEHVAFIGAGVSAEAGVPLAGEICRQIRDRLAHDLGRDDEERV